MSYDVEIWSVQPVELPGSLPEASRWALEGGSWVASGRSWQLAVEPSDEIWPEDIPERILPALPGIAYLTRLHLEPISAPGSARTLLHRTARALARSAHGVVLDPQEGSVAAPSGVKRFERRSREQVFSILALHWWFLEGPLLESGGVERLVGALETLLPEALPRRYGLHEPPQFVYDHEGRRSFEQFLDSHLDDLVVWYPKRPVVGVFIRARTGDELDRRGFRASTFALEIEASALALPGWERAIRRVWRRLSVLIEPFYGDVRTLGGFVRQGATYAVTGRSERHPVHGPWWNGVPRHLGHAVVLGRAYQEVWPELGRHAEQASGLWFCSTPSWRDSSDLSESCGAPPEPIAQPVAGDSPLEQAMRRYPATWPLPGPAPSAES